MNSHKELLDKFEILVNHNTFPSLRKGQFAWNLAYKLFIPNLSESDALEFNSFIADLSDTDKDCYYNDDNISNFVQAVRDFVATKK